MITSGSFVLHLYELYNLDEDLASWRKLELPCVHPEFIKPDELMFYRIGR